MEIVKVALVMAAGLGSTWAARVTTDALLSSAPAQTLVQATGQGDAGTPPGAGAASSPPAISEVSREEMDAELKRAQAQLSGAGRDTELREFRPTKPLPADLAIALPSDI
jgi:hypothetical protein